MRLIKKFIIWNLIVLVVFSFFLFFIQLYNFISLNAYIDYIYYFSTYIFFLFIYFIAENVIRIEFLTKVKKLLKSADYLLFVLNYYKSFHSYIVTSKEKNDLENIALISLGHDDIVEFDSKLEKVTRFGIFHILYLLLIFLTPILIRRVISFEYYVQLIYISLICLIFIFYIIDIIVLLHFNNKLNHIIKIEKSIT
jgi:hypothetical protein